MTSMPRVGLAVLFLFALQGCEDKGTCETAETEDKKDKKEACCKDGKPGEGPRPSIPRGVCSVGVRFLFRASGTHRWRTATQDARVGPAMIRCVRVGRRRVLQGGRPVGVRGGVE